MSIRTSQWTRRHFSQAMAASAATAFLGKKIHAEHTGLAFATSPDAVQVFRTAASRWTLLHEVEAKSPAHIVLHPSLPFLYVLHDVAQWDNLPRGAVSAYRVEPITGALKHMGTQPLSLSATHPRHAVLTADARALFVAAHTGGIYNHLPIAPEGTLRPVSLIRKEYGSSDNNKTATPHTTILHRDGSIFTVDPGQETVSRFLVNADGIHVGHRTRLQPGAGPSEIALSSNGRSLYVMQAKSGAIARHIIGSIGLSVPQQLIPSIGGELVPHPSGSFLLVGGKDQTQVVRLNTSNGAMAPHGSAEHSRLKSLRFAQNGSTLIALRVDTDEVVSIPFDSSTGSLGSATSLATVNKCTSLYHTA